MKICSNMAVSDPSTFSFYDYMVANCLSITFLLLALLPTNTVYKAYPLIKASFNILNTTRLFSVIK